MKEMIVKELAHHRETLEAVTRLLQEDIAAACQLAVVTINAGKKIMLCGNGGSAADAQHIAAELTGRYIKERDGLPGIALTTDTSALTAIANDYRFEDIFSRQVKALAQPGDLVIGISTTGNSANVINAFIAGKTRGCKTLGLSGKGGGKFKDNCDLNIVIPAEVTARIQEMHIMIGHMICLAIDEHCSQAVER
ncbi:MAG: SIS domain-containing protein [Calditrichales bacterium]|nr:MAG: SIS domain-containing protein [Calditrichales bacterium]